MFGAVLSDNAQTALALLGKSGVVKDAYLAGGSALALWYGHRESLDFDFFSSVAFDPKELSRTLSAVGSFTEGLAQGISLLGEFHGVKLSYFQYAYPVLEKFETYAGVHIAHPHDIAAMKLVAITDRSTRKDYIDLYELIHQGISIEVMLELYDKKYKLEEENRFSILRSLTYFDEADADEMPKMLKPIVWEDVKKFFTAEAIRLARISLEGEK